MAWVPCPICKGNGWVYEEQSLGGVRIGPSRKVGCPNPNCHNGRVLVPDEYKRTDVFYHSNKR